MGCLGVVIGSIGFGLSIFGLFSSYNSIPIEDQPTPKNEFDSKIERCLNLLKQKAPDYYQWFLTYNLKIRQYNVTAAHFGSSTIGISLQTLAASDEWVASILIHECIHFLQYRSGKYKVNTNGTIDGENMTACELEANNHQRIILDKLHAPNYHIEYLLKHDGKHWVPNKLFHVF